MLDSSGLFGTSRSATRRVIAELADHVAMIEVPFGDSVTAIDPPIGSTRCD
ncbi:MAG: hypothetical protein IT379_33785 [Deltaproteobacteria bacterium]|nr:hypothetical protein [Deltaproteobacteria bacterium]